MDASRPSSGSPKGSPTTATTTGSGTGGRCSLRVRCRSYCRTTSARPTGHRAAATGGRPRACRGQDIEPHRYGQRHRTPCRARVPRSLDEIELSYARLAVDGGVPLLGICRGCQIVNVAFGGTLYGDLEEFPEGGADHPGAKWDEWRALVAATLEGRDPPLIRRIRSRVRIRGRCCPSISASEPWSTAITTRRCWLWEKGSRAVAWAPHGSSRPSRCRQRRRSSWACNGSSTKSGGPMRRRSGLGVRSSGRAARRSKERDAVEATR